MPAQNSSPELQALDKRIKSVEQSIAKSQEDLKNYPNDVPRSIFLQAKQATLKNLMDEKKAFEKRMNTTNKYKNKRK